MTTSVTIYLEYYTLMDPTNIKTYSEIQSVENYQPAMDSGLITQAKIAAGLPLTGIIYVEENVIPITFDSSDGENIVDQINRDKSKIDGESSGSSNNPNSAESTEDISTGLKPYVKTPNSNDSSTVAELMADIATGFKHLTTWDPRLIRYDEYFELEDDNNNNDNDKFKKTITFRAPFASNTIATAFADETNLVDHGLIQAFVANGQIKEDSYIGKIYKEFDNAQDADRKNITEISENEDKTSKGNPALANAIISEKFMTHDTKKFTETGDNYGVQSIMNPYSLTKLVGGIVKNGSTGFVNYMYDVRDQRRFYAMQESGDPLSISNPTVTQLINWSNTDLWGRTPYSFQDFVYCKYFGLIPNNRLITLRRYTVPTYDNLQFSDMNGDQENTTVDSSGNKVTSSWNDLNNNENKKSIMFSPKAYVVTWFGGETGNSLNSLMSFTTGINWTDAEAKIWEVAGDTGETKQATIDRMLEKGSYRGFFGGADFKPIENAMQGASQISAKIASYGKFDLALNGDIGRSQDAYEKLMGANVDPYDSTFQNRILGPINRIDKVKKRKEGIVFSQTLNIKCAYQAKAIGGINPKAALLDVLGNCLEMVSPHAVFWGGGHRFMIHPQLYPFHDGGWRDNYMEMLYDGKILGPDGMLQTALSGIKKVGENEQGEFSMDVAKSALTRMGGGALALIGSAINSISSMFGGSSVIGDNLFDIAGEAQGTSADEARNRADNQIATFTKNLKQMWNNKVMAETIFPSITAGGNLLIGEPTGEWHLTVGNPLNPIMVIGNLICKEMKVTWDEQLGPDDFPIGFEVEYSLEHAMARDSQAIQSMFNRGMGKFYSLPDYITTSSDRVTYVDKHTKNAGEGDVGTFPYKYAGDILQEEGWNGYKTRVVSPGQTAANAGNWNTTVITKFTPLNGNAGRTIRDRRNGNEPGILARVRSMASTRKLVNN